MIPVITALAVGIALATQGVINTELSRYVGRVRAVVVSLTVSAITILIVLLLRWSDGSFDRLLQAPRWSLIGGTLGVIVLFGTVFAVPRIGAAATTGLIVTAQLITAAVIDRFGLLGVAMRPLTPSRIAALVLFGLAAYLITRG